MMEAPDRLFRSLDQMQEYVNDVAPPLVPAFRYLAQLAVVSDRRERNFKERIDALENALEILEEKIVELDALGSEDAGV